MKYFTYAELLRSQTALEHGFENIPSDYEVYNRLGRLVINLLDPIRERFAVPMIVTSGYRCERLNALVGGESNSQHMKGEAIDFYFQGFSKREMTAAFFEIAEKFDYDQLILYRYSGFIHVSFVGERNRHQAFVR